MGQPDSTDLHVRETWVFSCDEPKQYFNEAFEGLWLTEHGYRYDPAYVGGSRRNEDEL
jgi:hypothetical protein